MTDSAGSDPMTIEDDIAFLERMPILRRLGAPALRILAIGAESRELGRAGSVHGRRDGRRRLYGAARIVRPADRRDNQPEVVAGPGTLLGETALLDGNAASGHARRARTRDGLRISRAMFLKDARRLSRSRAALRDPIAARAEQWARDMDNLRATLAPDGKRR